jgi:hypothetical protein
MEDKVSYEITRDYIENLFTREFTDQEWKLLASEIDSLIEYWVDSDLPGIIENLPSLVEEDSKSE